jgi:peptide deformylase
MPVREVVRYPDPLLKQVCEPLAATVGGRVAIDLARDLLDTMDSFPGCVGIAAPQIGELFRMIAFDVRGHRKTRSCAGRVVMINPVIEQRSGAVVLREGCLSIPDFTGNVRRAESIIVSGTTPEGLPLKFACDAYEARVVLHEIDHLDGVLFLDRVASAKDVFPRKRYQ